MFLKMILWLSQLLDGFINSLEPTRVVERLLGHYTHFTDGKSEAGETHGLIQGHTTEKSWHRTLSWRWPKPNLPTLCVGP